MSTALVSTTVTGLWPRDGALPPVPWRDPHSVSSEDLATYTRQLEAACQADPLSANLRMCLGIAYAVGYDVYKSMDALEEALVIDPDHFWARLKYAELLYRLRSLPRAEEETRRAADAAANSVQLAIARRQMKEIRDLKKGSVRNVEWTKPLTAPALLLALMFAAMFFVMSWR